MNSNSRVRIIKPAERRRRREARSVKKPASTNRIEQENATDAAAAVTGWIGEWRQHKQKSAETAREFGGLFDEAV